MLRCRKSLSFQRICLNQVPQGAAYKQNAFDTSTAQEPLSDTIGVAKSIAGILSEYPK